MKHLQVFDLYTGRLSMVTNVFPTPYVPEKGAFNANLALEFVRQGLKVDVVVCQGIVRKWWDSMRMKPKQDWDFSMIDITVANVLELGRWCPLPEWLRKSVEQHSLRRSIVPILAHLKSTEGLVYAVFVDVSVACIEWCVRMHVPLFVELPESEMDSHLRIHGREAMRRLVQGCRGIVADSVDNRQFCLDLVPGCEEKVEYIPNSADTRRFYPMDKASVRKKLGLPEQEKIVVFCGHFIERKGPLRVLEALRLAGGVKGIFLGQGPQKPKGSLVLRAATVANSELPLWMNAADVFVLPSLAEGLANVIVEAMACGLPLIVSDRSFNRNFLTEECAVFVDPESPQDMANALKALLRDDVRCKSMSSHALTKSQNFSMLRRVEKIRAFIQRRVAGP